MIANYPTSWYSTHCVKFCNSQQYRNGKLLPEQKEDLLQEVKPQHWVCRTATKPSGRAARSCPLPRNSSHMLTKLPFQPWGSASEFLPQGLYIQRCRSSHIPTHSLLLSSQLSPQPHAKNLNFIYNLPRESRRTWLSTQLWNVRACNSDSGGSRGDPFLFF